MTFQNNPVTKKCSHCGKGFQCQTREAHGRCWCSLYPKLETIDGEKDCMCSDCLSRSLLEQNMKEPRP